MDIEDEDQDDNHQSRSDRVANYRAELSQGNDSQEKGQQGDRDHTGNRPRYWPRVAQGKDPLN